MEKQENKMFQKSEIVTRTMYYQGEPAYLYFLIGCADIKYFDERVYPGLVLGEKVMSIRPELTKPVEEKDIEYEIYSGNILFHGNTGWYSFALSLSPKRSCGDTMSEAQTALGSRDGFNEDLRDNLGLIRSRVKTRKLIIEELKLGRISQTKVMVMGIENIVQKERYEQIIVLLKEIDIDGIYHITDISSKISKHRIFPMDRCTGSPDEVAVALCNGQIVILAEKIPVAMVTPTSLLFASKSKTDAETPIFYIGVQRIFVMISIFLSVFLMGLFASLLRYHQNDLSYFMVSNLKVAEKGLLFPIYIEIFIALFLFDLIHLVGTRTPSTIYQVIVLICGLVIGQNTLQSGLVSVFVMMVCTFCFMSSFAVSNDPRVVMSLELCRSLILFFSILFGFIGFFLSVLFLCAYVMKHQFLGISFFHPFIPFSFPDVKRFFGSRNFESIHKRPEVLQDENKTFKKN